MISMRVLNHAALGLELDHFDEAHVRGFVDSIRGEPEFDQFTMSMFLEGLPRQMLGDFWFFKRVVETVFSTLEVTRTRGSDGEFRLLLLLRSSHMITDGFGLHPLKKGMTKQEKRDFTRVVMSFGMLGNPLLIMWSTPE